MEIRFSRLIVPVLMVCMLFFYFCRKANKQPQASPAQKAEAFMPQGSWRVTYFIENGNDKGKDLKDYEFVFKRDGTAYAIKNGASIRGAWTSVPGNKQEGILMSFVVWPTDGISKSWQITEASNEKVHLVNKGESEGKSHLVLERK